MSYLLTETATADLDEILLYIADRDGLDRALHVHQQFEAAFAALDATPMMGTVRPDLTGDQQRWWFGVFNYTIIYQPVDNDVVILRVLHGARDLAAVFGDD